MIEVVALGELLIDFTCADTDAHGYPTMAAHPGGAPANFLAALQKYGIQSAMFSAVGNDTFGHLLISTLQTAGIDTRGVLALDSFFTTLAFVTLDQNGDRSFAFSRKPGADTQIAFEALPLALLDEASVLHFGTLSLTHNPARATTRAALAYARECGKLISFDPNLRPPLWDDLARAKEEMLWGLSQADVVKISDEEVQFLFGGGLEDGAQRILADYGVSLVFITRGKDGCYYKNALAEGYVQNFNEGLHVVDTTGAGDIFGGAAMSRLLASQKAPDALTDAELRHIATFACAAASLSTEQFGGIHSVPDKAAVLRLLEGRA